MNTNTTFLSRVASIKDMFDLKDHNGSIANYITLGLLLVFVTICVYILPMFM